VVPEAEDENPDVAGMGVSELKSSMTNAEYLDAISAPRDEAKLKKKTKSKPKRSRKGKEKAEENDGFESSITLSDDDPMVMD